MMEKYNVNLNLYRQKMRLTKQRKAILDLLRSTDVHPTADWIYERLRMILPNISLGTVYHNLSILEQQGFIMKIEVSNGPSKYDGRVDGHYHITCVRCGRYDDLNFPVRTAFDEEVSEEVSSRSGYRILSHQLTFKGICPSCRTMEDAIAV